MDIIYELIFAINFPIYAIIGDGVNAFINIHDVPEGGVFLNLPPGYYFFSFTDSKGNQVGEWIYCGEPPTSTTTTTIEVTTTTTTVAPTTTTTTIEVTTTTTTSEVIYDNVVSCLQGLKIEAIYINNQNDLDIINSHNGNAYVHPCPSSFQKHGCNNALFEIFGNEVYIMDALMNNDNGEGGPNPPCQTAYSHNQICRDYFNVPNLLVGNNSTPLTDSDIDRSAWKRHGGTRNCRYSVKTLSVAEAVQIANAGGGNGTDISFRFACTNVDYGCSCKIGEVPFCHDERVDENIAWIRISRADGFVVYNGCPYRGFVTIDICNGMAVLPTTTTTTVFHPTAATTTTTVSSPVVECLNGMTIEMIYLDGTSDLALLPSGYNHPCPTADCIACFTQSCTVIGQHFCNRGLFELYGNGIYIGDSMMNNMDGVGGGATAYSGNQICQDYYNRPDELQFPNGGTWTGSQKSRYNKYTLTYQQALQIGMVTPQSNEVLFTFEGAIEKYGSTCDTVDYSHENITWVRITDSNGVVKYNGVPVSNFLKLNVCTGVVVSTSTTTVCAGCSTTTSTTTTTVIDEEYNTLFVKYSSL